MLTSVMRFFNFVSKVLMASLTCESWIRLQTIILPMVLVARGVWLLAVFEDSAADLAQFDENITAISTMKTSCERILRIGDYVTAFQLNQCRYKFSRKSAMTGSTCFRIRLLTGGNCQQNKNSFLP